MFFTQSSYVLTIRPPSIDEVERLLQKHFTIEGRTSPKEGEESKSSWAMADSALMVRMAGVETGRLLVDVVDSKWPDEMGDPQRRQSLFNAWSTGAFGPLVYPGALTRAARQAWIWKQASGAARAHLGFIRVRAIHVAPEGAAPEPPDPKLELLAITDMTRRLIALNGTLCHFNPNGEALRSPTLVKAAMDQHQNEGVLPLDLWTNVRVIALEGTETWAVMDTVGLAQLSLPDIEVGFPRERFELEVVDVFVRSVADYVAEAGDVIAEGHTVDGPGEIQWRAERYEQGAGAPPRAVVRLLPDDGTEVPDALKPGAEGAGTVGSEGLEEGEPGADGEESE